MLKTILIIVTSVTLFGVLFFMYVRRSLKKRLNEIYSKHTGRSVEEISSALERDRFMTPEEAKKFGLIDKVVEKRS